MARVCAILKDDEAALQAQQSASRLPEAGLPELPDPMMLKAEMREVLSKKLAQQADIYMASGNWDAAIKAFEILTRKRPDFPRPRLNLAQCLLMKGETSEAIKIYRDLCQGQPGNANLRFSLALALEHVGDDDGAIAAYREATRLKPDYASAHFNLGLILERHGALASAADAYEAAVQADPKFAPAHLALGVLLQKTGGNVEESLKHLRAAVRLAPGDAVPRSYLDRALRDRQPDNSSSAGADEAEKSK